MLSSGAAGGVVGVTGPLVGVVASAAGAGGRARREQVQLWRVLPGPAHELPQRPERPPLTPTQLAQDPRPRLAAAWVRMRMLPLDDKEPHLSPVVSCGRHEHHIW